MASRSFKPASCMVATNKRPSFARSSSSSSEQSIESEDSISATLQSLSISGNALEKEGTSASSSHSNTQVNNSSSSSHPYENTPGRKQSDPIAINLPSSRREVATPLTARGDLPGGYFPDHEEIQPSYKPHPFNQGLTKSKPKLPNSPPMSTSNPSPSSDSTIRGPAAIMSSSLHMPEQLIIPMGKYYPSNYKPSPTSPVPFSLSPTFSPTFSPTSTRLTIPAAGQRNKNLHHQRRPSDIKRKIQKYQKDMIEQARLASALSPSASHSDGKKPASPKLLPLGSPGPITPFELEESAGYLIAGHRRSGGPIGGDREAIEKMIREEEEQRRREGQSSPVARV